MQNRYAYIQAQPGWMLVEGIRNRNKITCDLHHEPVIAWALVEMEPATPSEYPHVAPLPITVNGLETEDVMLLRRPDGSYYDIARLEEFASSQEAIEYLQEINQEGS